MSANIVRLYYKENSKEPAVNEALVDLAQVSMIVRIGQQTVGLVVPGGWYEYALVTDNLTGIEKTTRSADKFIELTSTWMKLHEVEPPKKLGHPAKAETPKAESAAPDFSKVPPPGDEWVEKLKDMKPTATLNGSAQRRTLTAMADKMISAGVPQPAPLSASVRPPVMPPRQVIAAHSFQDSSGLPITIDLRDIATMSPYTDGSRKVRMGLHRGGTRVVVLPVEIGETFETVYTYLYYKWAEIATS